MTLGRRCRTSTFLSLALTWQKRDMPGFADYEVRTARPIPVVILKLSEAPLSPPG
jgi:hypothetical protein